MSDVTIMYNLDGFWVEVNVDSLETLVSELPELTTIANNRVTSVN